LGYWPRAPARGSAIGGEGDPSSVASARCAAHPRPAVFVHRSVTIIAAPNRSNVNTTKSRQFHDMRPSPFLHTIRIDVTSTGALVTIYGIPSHVRNARSHRASQRHKRCAGRCHAQRCVAGPCDAMSCPSSRGPGPARGQPEVTRRGLHASRRGCQRQRGLLAAAPINLAWLPRGSQRSKGRGRWERPNAPGLALRKERKT